MDIGAATEALGALTVSTTCWTTSTTGHFVRKLPPQWDHSTGFKVSRRGRFKDDNLVEFFRNDE
jgi:hypothetical protein